MSAGVAFPSHTLIYTLDPVAVPLQANPLFHIVRIRPDTVEGGPGTGASAGPGAANIGVLWNNVASATRLPRVECLHCEKSLCRYLVNISV